MKRQSMLLACVVITAVWVLPARPSEMEAATAMTAGLEPFWYHHPDGPSRLVKLELTGGALTESARVEAEFLGKKIVREIKPDEKPSRRINLYLSIDNPKKPAQAAIVLKTGTKTMKASVTIEPERKWEVHLLHHTHLDIGYTHHQEEVLRIQVDGLKKAMQYIEASKDYPKEARFTWHPEGMWAIEEFLRTATPEEKNQFIKKAKSGSVHQDVLYAQAMTGIYSEEELFELMGSAKRFERKYDIPPIVSAMETDIPGHTWGFVPALAHSGVKYFTSGPNHSYRIGHSRVWNDRPFYWKSPSGKHKILFWMAGEGYCWFYGSAVGSRIDPFSKKNNHQRSMIQYLDRLEREGYPYDIVQVRYIIGKDNGPPNPALPDVVKEWNEKYAYPKMIITSNSGMCRELEKRYGDKIPVVTGDFTPYWEDGAATTAEDLALNRRAAERLVQAQVLWAMLNPEGCPSNAFDQAWIKIIMYDEHTWGAHCSVSKPESEFTLKQYEYKRKYALDGARMTDELIEKAARSGKIKHSGHVVVYNTTSWDRTDEVVFLDRDLSSAGDTVKDEKGKVVPSQRLASGELAIVPGTMPPFSSRRFTVHKGSARAIGTAYVDGLNLGNDLVSLEIDPKTGAIKSLNRKGIPVNLVDPESKQGINDYLYIRGMNGDVGRSRIKGPVKVTVEDVGPLVAALSIESDAPGCKKMTRRIRIVSGRDLVDCLNITEKLKERGKEGVYFAYPFNIPGGTTRIDTPWVVIRPEKDQIEGANRNVYCVQRYVDVSSQDYGVTWVTIDAPFLQFDPIKIPDRHWLKRIEPNQTFYSWAMMNHHGTNYKACQDGVIAFRYILAPHAHAYDQAKAQRIARGLHQPLMAFAAEPSRSEARSLFSINGDGVVVSSVKPSRDGKALMVRLFNVSDKEQKISLDWGKKPKKTWISNPMEDRVSKADRLIGLTRNEIVTLRAEK